MFRTLALSGYARLLVLARLFRLARVVFLIYR